jgi:hypothetical protein
MKQILSGPYKRIAKFQQTLAQAGPGLNLTAITPQQTA